MMALRAETRHWYVRDETKTRRCQFSKCGQDIEVHVVLIAVVQLLYTFITSRSVNVIINYTLAMTNSTHISIPVCHVHTQQGWARDVEARDGDVGFTSRDGDRTGVSQDRDHNSGKGYPVVNLHTKNHLDTF